VLGTYGELDHSWISETDLDQVFDLLTGKSGGKQTSSSLLRELEDDVLNFELEVGVEESVGFIEDQVLEVSVKSGLLVDVFEEKTIDSSWSGNNDVSAFSSTEFLSLLSSEITLDSEQSKLLLENLENLEDLHGELSGWRDD
jgi:hypothetical protein